MKVRAINRMTWWLCLWLFAHSFVSSSSLAQDNVQPARDVVHAFLQSEFKGDVLDEREKLIKFTPKRRDYIESKVGRPGPGPYVLYVLDYPLFIVSAYEIVKVEVMGDRASAIVSYNRLGLIKSYGHSVPIPDKKDHDLVTLNLVFDKNQWWVLDPPPPRVSKEVLIRSYEATFKDAAINTQRWRRAEKMLKLLNSL